MCVFVSYCIVHIVSMVGVEQMGLKSKPWDPIFLQCFWHCCVWWDVKPCSIYLPRICNFSDSLSRFIRLIGVVFSNGAMLSVSDKYDSVYERT